MKARLEFWYRGLIGWWHSLTDHPVLPDLNFYRQILIGNSRNGLPIFAYTPKVTTTKKTTDTRLFLAATHGNEVGTTHLVLKAMAYLAQQKKETGQVYFLPILNPDGREQALLNPDFLNGGRIGRVNATQVDLGRNFPTKSFQQVSVWSRGKNYQERVKINAGAHPLSEPETQSLIKFVTEKNISTIISYHSVGADIVCSQDKTAQKITQKYCQDSGFAWQSQRDWSGLNQTGTLKEWCEENNRSYIEIENSCRWGSDWQKQKNALVATLLDSQII